MCGQTIVEMSSQSHGQQRENGRSAWEIIGNAQATDNLETHRHIGMQ